MKILRTINFLAPAQNLKLSSEIGPTLGQINVKAKPFCDKFNEGSKKIHRNILVKVFITAYTNLTVSFNIKGYSLSFLLFYCSKKRIYKNKIKNFLNIKEIYKIAIIKIEESKKNYPMDIKDLMENIMYICKSLNFKIEYER